MLPWCCVYPNVHVENRGIKYLWTVPFFSLTGSLHTVYEHICENGEELLQETMLKRGNNHFSPMLLYDINMMFSLIVIDIC